MASILKSTANRTLRNDGKVLYDIVCMCQCQIRAHVNRGKSLCLPLLAANYVTNQHFRVFAPLLCSRVTVMRVLEVRGDTVTGNE